MISSHTWEALIETSVRKRVFAEDGHCHGIVGNILSAFRPRLMKMNVSAALDKCFSNNKTKRIQRTIVTSSSCVCRGLPCSFSLCVTISTLCCRHWNQTVPGSCRACHAHLDVCVCVRPFYSDGESIFPSSEWRETTEDMFSADFSIMLTNSINAWLNRKSVNRPWIEVPIFSTLLTMLSSLGQRAEWTIEWVPSSLTTTMDWTGELWHRWLNREKRMLRLSPSSICDRDIDAFTRWSQWTWHMIVTPCLDGK